MVGTLYTACGYQQTNSLCNIKLPNLGLYRQNEVTNGQDTICIMRFRIVGPYMRLRLSMVGILYATWVNQ